VSVVVPVLDEEALIERCVGALSAFCPPWELLVVDGGSADATLERATRATAAVEGRVLRAERGRGAQLNAGARVARGDVLLFLHADVTLPADAPAWIERAFADQRVVAGAFRTRTVSEAGVHVLSPLLRIADVRSRVSRLPYGDQALFVRRAEFEEVGGFPEIPLLEDLEMSRRLSRRGLIRTVPRCVRVSGRRILSRPLRSALTMNLFPLLYRLGVSPAVLARFYGHAR
jgi:rSAM/selenodomain-associated transferase 2